MPEPGTPVDFGTAAPILRVEKLAASLEYYTKVLGFQIDWQFAEMIASVSRGRCCIFLCAGDQGNPGSWVWIGVSDAETLHRELKDRGAKVRHPPTNYKWALEMQIEDLDGNVLRMGSDPKHDQPYGPWLDMHGRVWPSN